MSKNLYRTIEQEAHVVRSCLCVGLTEIRNANLNEKGRYYSAFFQLAIGIERLAKLALILDHLAQNNLVAPGHQVVKAYGHDLHTLIARVEDTATVRGYAASSDFPQSLLCKSVQAFLSEFATGMRYANLDALASGSARRNPLREWNAILQAAVTRSVSKSTQQRVATRSAAVSQALSGRVAVIASDLAGDPLTLNSAFAEPSLLDSASKHLVWELVTLLVPLRDVVVKAGYATDAIAVAAFGNRTETRVPELSEFFEFLAADRTYVLRKKRWP